MAQAATIALEQLAERVGLLATDEVRREFSECVGNAAMQELAAGFNQSRDPYGRRWASLVQARPTNIASIAGASSRGRSLASVAAKVKKSSWRRILVLTGRLVTGFRMRPAPEGFRIWLVTDYGKFHQYGTRRMAQRQMVPEASTSGVGALWGEAMNREADVELRRRVAA